MALSPRTLRGNPDPGKLLLRHFLLGHALPIVRVPAVLPPAVLNSRHDTTFVGTRIIRVDEVVMIEHRTVDTWGGTGTRRWVGVEAILPGARLFLDTREPEHGETTKRRGSIS